MGDIVTLNSDPARINPCLTTRLVTLRPVTRDDYGDLYKAETGEWLAFRWRLRGRHGSPEDFERALWSGALLLFMIDSVHRPSVGVVSVYGADFGSGLCRFAAAEFSASTGWRTMCAASFLTFDYVFAGFPFRRILLEVPEFNLEQFGSAMRRNLFTSAGCLRDHLYLDGRYWDQHLLVLDRDSWMKFRATPLASSLLQ